jgi:CRP-like cAMP-binding protein
MFAFSVQLIQEESTLSQPLANIKSQPCHPAFTAPSELFSALDGIASELHAQAGDCVFREGSLCTGVYLLRDGSVRAYLAHKNGTDIVNAVLGPGAILGFPAAMCSRSFQFSAEALLQSTIGFVETRVLNSFLLTRPDLCMHVVGMMSDELIELRQTRDHMKTCTHTECSLYGACKHAH